MPRAQGTGNAPGISSISSIPGGQAQERHMYSMRWGRSQIRVMILIKCQVPCDHIPKKSYPLFRTRQILNDWLSQNQEEA